jgi:hypothetical protein
LRAMASVSWYSMPADFQWWRVADCSWQPPAAMVDLQYSRLPFAHGMNASRQALRPRAGLLSLRPRNYRM